MATIAVTPGSGTTVNTDTVGGANTQYIKVDGGGTTLTAPIENGTAANLAATVSTKALLVVQPGDWAVNHLPAAATQATITQAAGAAGVRHVCTSISATLATVGTAQTIISLALRDGATGAGTVKWAKQVVLPTNGLWEVNLSNLRIVGTAATAMTLEFSGANVAASYASVAMTGFDTPAA